MVLLDEDEEAEQQAFLSGPPPLGPGAPPLEGLLSYGRARHAFVPDHHGLLADAGRDRQTRFTEPFRLHDAHVRKLLQSAGTTEDLAAQAAALTALLEADDLEHRLADGATLDQLADACEGVAVKPCRR